MAGPGRHRPPVDRRRQPGPDGRGEAYSNAKLAILYYAHELQRRVGPGVAVSVFEPGWMPGTSLGRGAPAAARRSGGGSARLPGVATPERSGPVLAAMALDDQWAHLRDGAFVVRDKVAEVRPIAHDRDRDAACGTRPPSSRHPAPLSTVDITAARGVFYGAGSTDARPPVWRSTQTVVCGREHDVRRRCAMTTATDSYALGHEGSELDRLVSQSRFLGDLTEQLLLQAGLRPGMRALDVGCGVGDVTFLAARLVGADGSVIGVDRSPEAIERARQRAAEAGLTNVSFVVGDAASMPAEPKVDAVLGRLVLMYAPHPDRLVRRLSECVAPGGIVVFQEMDMGGAFVTPSAPLFELTVERVLETFAGSAPACVPVSSSTGSSGKPDCPRRP